MKKAGMMIAAVSCLASVAFAQVDEKRRAAAEELVAVMELEKMHEQSLAQMRTMVRERMKSMPSSAGDASSREAAPKTMDEMMALVEEINSWEKVKGDYIDTYAKAYTVDEMNALIAFQKTPIGQVFLKIGRLMSKRHDMMKKMMENSTEGKRK